MSDQQQYWVLYVTEGRDEYYTYHLGIFKELKTAVIKLVNFLISETLLSIGSDSIQHKIFLKKLESEMVDSDMQDLVHEFVKKYDAYFYEDGWDYTFEKCDVN